MPSLSRAMLALGRDGSCGEPCGLSDCLCPTHLGSHRHRPISGTDIATSVCMTYQLPTVVAVRESPSPFTRLPVLIPHAGSCCVDCNTWCVGVSTSVPRQGIEPRTHNLKGSCSATELARLGRMLECPHRESNPGLRIKSPQHYRHALEAMCTNDIQLSSALDWS